MLPTRIRAKTNAKTAKPSTMAAGAIDRPKVSGFDFAALEKPFQGEYLADAQGGGAQLPDELVSFGYEQPVFGAAAFVGQRADELYFGFGHGCCRFSIVNVVPSVAGWVSGNTVRASSTRTLSSL